MSLRDLFLTLKGGVGSGHWAHSGVLGRRGGSAPGGGGTKEFWENDIDSREDNEWADKIWECF